MTAVKELIIECMINIIDDVAYNDEDFIDLFYTRLNIDEQLSVLKINRNRYYYLKRIGKLNASIIALRKVDNVL